LERVIKKSLGGIKQREKYYYTHGGKEGGSGGVIRLLPMEIYSSCLPPLQIAMNCKVANELIVVVIITRGGGSINQAHMMVFYFFILEMGWGGYSSRKGGNRLQPKEQNKDPKSNNRHTFYLSLCLACCLPY